MKLDIPTLTQIVMTCFDHSLDGRFSEKQRSEFLQIGKRLRGFLINAISARFNEGTTEVLNANAEILAVNADLETVQLQLQNAANVIARVNALVGVLNQVLDLALVFV